MMAVAQQCVKHLPAFIAHVHVFLVDILKLQWLSISTMSAVFLCQRLDLHGAIRHLNTDNCNTSNKAGYYLITNTNMMHFEAVYIAMHGLRNVFAV